MVQELGPEVIDVLGPKNEKKRKERTAAELAVRVSGLTLAIYTIEVQSSTFRTIYV